MFRVKGKIEGGYRRKRNEKREVPYSKCLIPCLQTGGDNHFVAGCFAYLKAGGG